MSKTVREFIIKVNAEGQIEAIRGFEKLDKAAKQTAKEVGTVDRAQKGVAQATSNSTKEFAKQAQGLGGIVRIYATVAANVFALSSAYNVLRRNADLEILKTSSQQLSISTGQNFASIAQSIQNVTGGALEFRDAMQSANLALSGGLSGQQAQQIAEIATKAANALGRSVPEAVNRLTAAIVKAEPELADEFGIILRVTEATNEYGKAIGKLPTQLSTAQKMQAVFNQFLEQGTEKFANVDIQTNPYDKLAASFTNIINKVTELVRVPLDPFINLISSNGLILVSIFGAIAAKLTNLAIPALKEFSNVLATTAAAYSAEAAEKYIRAQESVIDANLAAVNSFEDYKSILSSALKDVDFSKLKMKGIDIGYLIGENIEEDLPKYLRSAVKGAEPQLEKLRKLISDKLANANPGDIINVKGLELNTRQARALMESLQLATVQGSAEAIKFFEQEISTLNRLGLKFDQVKSKAVAYFSAVKQAATSQFAAGLNTGFIDNLKALPGLFTDTILKAEGFGLKVAGGIGIASRGLGTFIGGMTKLLGILGPLGIAVSFAVTLFSQFSDFLGITSEESRKASKGLEEYKKISDLATEQLKSFKRIGKDSYSDQIDSARIAINLTGTFRNNIDSLKETFKNLDTASRSFWRNFWSDSRRSVEAFGGIRQQFKNIIETAQSEELRREGRQNARIELDVTNDFLGTNAQFDNVWRSNEEIAKLSNGVLKVKDGRLVLPFSILADDEELERFFKAVENSPVLKKIPNIRSRLAEEGSRAATTYGNKLDEVSRSAINFDSKLKDLNTELGRNVINLTSADPIYSSITSAISDMNDAIEGGSLILEAPNDNISPELQGIISRYIVLDKQATITNRTLLEGLTAAKAELDDFTLAVSSIATEEAKIGSKLIKVQDAITRGDISQISEEYTLQRDAIANQVKLLEIKNDQISFELSKLGEANSQSKKAQELALLRQQNEAKIVELKTKQNVQYSDTVANEKIALELSKTNEKVAQSRLNITNSTASVLDKLADITGNTSDIQNRLNFENQILEAKINQLNATIATKLAEQAGAKGTKLAEIQAEIQALQKQVEVTKQLSALEQIQKAADARTKQLELENKYLETQLKLEQGRIDIAKKRAEIISSSKFNTTADRDAAEELAIRLELASAEQARKESLFEVQKIEKEIASEMQKIDELNNSNITSAEKTRRLEELKLDLLLAEQEARAATLKQEVAIQKAREEQYQLAKKNADLFKRPEEFKAILGEEFRRAAEEFAEKMGSGINRIVNITTGTIDAGIDAFVDAVRSGENALQAARDAIVNTFLDLNNEFIKDQFKLVFRQGLGAIFGDAGKNFGKSPELIIAEQDLIIQQGILTAVQTMAAQGGITGPNGKDIFSNEFISKLNNGLIKDPISSGAEKELISSLTKGSDQQKMIMEQTADMFKDSNSSFLSGLTDMFSGFFSNFNMGGLGTIAGDALSGIGGLIMQGINLFFAKGGLTGEITKRIPMYARGTVTSGPELAMIGEGSKREAVVPLPDNRSIPVTMTGEPESQKTVNNSFNINITGVQGNEQGIRKSANQLALEIARAQETARRRIG